MIRHGLGCSQLSGSANNPGGRDGNERFRYFADSRKPAERLCILGRSEALATTHQKIEQGARSREALLDAAIELIADGGYTATGVDAIARRSGVVKSALYWHFGSKDGLLIAALERTARDWVAEFESQVVIQAEPAQRLENLFTHVRNLFYHRPERIRLILSALIERGPENEEVRVGVARILGVMRDA